jgi:small nuclear ribonucleoprotein (snRNP)-like protein
VHQAYDAHMNLILSDVEETITLVDVGDDGAVSGVRVSDSFSGVLLSSHTDNRRITKECRKKHGDAFRSRRRCDHGKAAHVLMTWKVRSCALHICLDLTNPIRRKQAMMLTS